MHDEIKKIFESLELDKEVFTEDVMKQFALLIESQVGTHKAVLEEELQLEYEARYEVDKENLVDQLDEYLNYFAESFIEENREQIVEAVEVNTAKKVLEKMDNFVNEFNISLSEDNLTSEEEMDDMRSDLNEAINENLELRTVLIESQKSSLIEDASYGIDIDSKREAFVQIAESLEYEDGETFQENLDFLAEKINNSKEEETYTLEEQELFESQEQTLEESTHNDNSPMKDYLKFIKR